MTTPGGFITIRSITFSMNWKCVTRYQTISRAASGRVERTLQAIALINGIDVNGEYRLRYLYRANEEHSVPIIEKAYANLEELL